jgi:hypothetical protein
MTLGISRVITDQDRKEHAALTKIIERLCRMFPELSEEDVHRAVHGKYSDFEQSPIRDYVPVLVENVARNELGRQVRQYRA